jgi:hypothetical protein
LNPKTDQTIPSDDVFKPEAVLPRYIQCTWEQHLEDEAAREKRDDARKKQFDREREILVEKVTKVHDLIGGDLGQEQPFTVRSDPYYRRDPGIHLGDAWVEDLIDVLIERLS